MTRLLSQESLAQIDREIAKYYLCIALGRIEPPKGRIECFLRKDEKSNTDRKSVV